MDQAEGNHHGVAQSEIAAYVFTGFREDGEPNYREHFVESTNSDKKPSPPSGTKSPLEIFYSERERLKTFEGTWKDYYLVRAADLARDGFIYKGPADSAKCVFCLKAIKEWDSKDVVAEEHKRLIPSCKGLYDIRNKPKTGFEFTRLSNRDLHKHMDMKSLEDRLETFKRWEKRRTITPEILAKSGFFYNDSSRILTCFNCDMEVPAWNSENNLLKHHAEMSPKCHIPHYMSRSGEETSGDIALQESGAFTVATNVKGNEIPDIEEDMKSPAVEAVVKSYGDDYTMADIRKALTKLRLSNPSGHIDSRVILEVLEPDSDDNMDM